MRTQLDSAPYPVTRVDATPADLVFQKCTGIPGLPVKNPGEAANFFTNYLLWKSVLQEDAGDDFIIVLEDDLALHDEFWPRVQELVNGPCQFWDYLSTDLFVVMEGEKPAFAPLVCERHCGECARRGGEMEPIANLDGEGSHMAIVRVSALRKIVDAIEGGGVQLPLDHFNQVMSMGWSGDDVEYYAWQPRVVSQFGRYEVLDNNQVTLPSVCLAANLSNSDVLLR